MQRVQYIGKRTYSRRYGPGVGYTTRRVPGYFRTPSRGVYTRRLRGRYAGGGSVKAQLRRLAEQKYNVVQYTSLGITATPQVLPLSDEIQEGATAITRVGDKITVNSIELRGRLTIDSTDAAYPALVSFRMVVIKWYDDSTPTYADVFETVDYTSDPLVPLMHAPFNSDRKVKRKVLLDKTYTVNRGLAAVWNGAAVVSSTYPELGTRVCFTHFIDLKKKGDKVRNIHYGAGSTDGVGNFYVLVISDTAANGPLLSFISKVNYTDV